MSQQDNIPINLEEQINCMKKYVNFRQNKKMREYLKCVGYFRASRYGKYLLSHTMQLGRKPDHNLLFNLYRLDMELRKLFFEYCQYIEIQTRTYISDFISLEICRLKKLDVLFLMYNFYYFSSALFSTLISS